MTGPLLHYELAAEIRLRYFRSYLFILTKSPKITYYRPACLHSYELNFKTGIFYVAWRKSVRYLLNIPRRTHCSLLHYICDDVPINIQLCNRFKKFLISLENSNNPLIKTCHELIMQGSQSAVSNSLSFTANVLKCNRRHLRYTDTMKMNTFDNDDFIKCTVIRDVLEMQFQNRYGQVSILERDDLEYMLNELCVE